MKKIWIFFFFEIFEKSADFATKFGWGISATKGSPLWKKNEIDQKRYPNISVFFGFHFVFFGFSGTRGNFPLRKKKKNEMDRITPNWTEQLGYLLLPFFEFFGAQGPKVRPKKKIFFSRLEKHGCTKYLITFFYFFWSTSST